MDVQIIGAGSVGMLVASYLIGEHHSVTLVVRNEQQLMELKQLGLTRVMADGQSTTQAINAVRELRTDADLTIVTVKSYQLQSLYNSLAQLPKNMPLLFMQNGLAHYEQALKLPQLHIAFASVQFGARKETLTTVNHTGLGPVKLAIAKGQAYFFEWMATSTNSQFPIVLEMDAYDMLFEKALLNCFINPMTAILQVKNGRLIENPASYQLLIQLYDELMNAFPSWKARFPFAFVVSLCEKTALNTSSMLMDRLHHRQFEVDAIMKPIMQRALRDGITLPTLSTLYYLISSIELERENAT